MENDSNTAEMYLECFVEDESLFSDLTAAAAQLAVCTEFPYADEFQVYSISNSYVLGENDYVQQADIQMVIIQPEKHLIIYELMLVNAPDIARAIDFMSFFNRFGIDAKTYAAHTEHG